MFGQNVPSQDLKITETIFKFEGYELEKNIIKKCNIHKVHQKAWWIKYVIYYSVVSYIGWVLHRFHRFHRFPTIQPLISIAPWLYQTRKQPMCRCHMHIMKTKHLKGCKITYYVFLQREVCLSCRQRIFNILNINIECAQEYFHVTCCGKLVKIRFQ
jgi:hypothetical protein